MSTQYTVNGQTFITTGTAGNPSGSNSVPANGQLVSSKVTGAQLPKSSPTAPVTYANGVYSTGGQNYSIDNPTTPAAPNAPMLSQPTPIDTSRPSAQNAASYVVKPGDTLNGIANTQGVKASDITGYKSGNPNLITPGENLTIGNQQKAGLAAANASGTSAPNTSGQASAAMQTYTPPAQSTPDPAQTDAVLADNKAHQQYIDDYTKSQSSAAQNESLTQTYTDLSNTLGIPALDTQLMNMNNVMNGTEQDIRDEITKAGGFATNSQVLALTDARNKTLLQNYNILLQTKNDAMQNLTTMIGLAEKDQANAEQRVNNQLNFDQQNISYADKAVTNAQDVYKNLQASEGWDGIYKAALASGDPQAIQKINSTMGTGFDLAALAQAAANARAQATTKTNLENAQASANLTKTNAEIAATNLKTAEDNGLPVPGKENAPGFNAQGIKYTNSSATTELQNEMKTQGLIGTRNLLAPSDYNQMKAWWVLQGLSNTDFDNVFGQYKDTSKKTSYN